MEEMIYTFFLSHGWKLTLIALSGIVLLGILKAFNVFRKIDDDKKKYLYGAISTTFSILASLVYLLVAHKFAWSTFGLLSAGIYAVNQAAYAFYETYGVRALFRKIGNLLLSAVNKNKKTTLTLGTVDDLANKEEKK